MLKWIYRIVFVYTTIKVFLCKHKEVTVDLELLKAKKSLVAICTNCGLRINVPVQ